MPSITTWHRLESRTRAASISDGLKARIHDPLWLLARQWQLGEFKGDDAGSPVSVTVTTDSTRFERVRAEAGGPPSGEARPWDPAAEPLEAAVAGIPLEERPTLARAASAGAQLLRQLDAGGLGALRGPLVGGWPVQGDAWPPLPGDATGARLLSTLAGRALDGLALYRAVEAQGAAGVAAQLGLDPDAATALEAALTQWKDQLPQWSRGLSAWEGERLAHRFAVGAPSWGVSPNSSIEPEETILRGTWSDGALDWHCFDVGGGEAMGTAGAAERRTAELHPTPVRYRGMPRARFWEIEDHPVDFSAVRVPGSDLGRMLFVEFALTTGDDWFLAPVALPYGAVSRVAAVQVKDTFGEVHTLPPVDPGPAGPGRWAMFRPEQGVGADGVPKPPQPWLVLPPVDRSDMEGEAVEAVDLVLDEVSNLGWAVERVAEGGAGRPLRRQGAPRALGRTELSADPLPYTLMARAPAHWFPLLPVPGAGGEPALRQGTFTAADGAADPWGFELDGALSVSAPEVGREGAGIALRFHRARGADGSVHLWLARERTAGQGPGDGGLRFDRLGPR